MVEVQIYFFPLLPVLLMFGAIGHFFARNSYTKTGAIDPVTTTCATEINIDEDVEPDINYRIRIKMKDAHNEQVKEYQEERFELEHQDRQEEIEKNRMGVVKDSHTDYLQKPGWKYLYPANNQRQDSNKVPSEHWSKENVEQNSNYQINPKLQPDQVNADYPKDYQKTSDWRYQNPQYYERQHEQKADGVYPMRQKYTVYNGDENEQDRLADAHVEQVNNNYSRDFPEGSQ